MLNSLTQFLSSNLVRQFFLWEKANKRLSVYIVFRRRNDKNEDNETCFEIKNNQIMWELQLDFDSLTLLTDLRKFIAPSTANPLDG